MHPELLDHPFFTRYYQRWQDNPRSAAFVGVADLLCSYHYYDDARRVCEIGLEHNPQMVSGRLVLARILHQAGNSERAAEELRKILQHDAKHREAQAMLRRIAPAPFVEARAVPAEAGASEPVDEAVHTMTMAQLYAMQGHYDEARKIYERIAAAEPENQDVLDALADLPSAVELAEAHS